MVARLLDDKHFNDHKDFLNVHLWDGNVSDKIQMRRIQSTTLGNVLSNKFESNNDAATCSFASSFFHLAHYFVLVVNLFWSFICMVVHSFRHLIYLCGGNAFWS